MAKHPVNHSPKRRARRRARIIRWSIVGFLMLALGVGVGVGVLLEPDSDVPEPTPWESSECDWEVGGSLECYAPASSTMIFPSDEVEFVDPIPVER